MKKAEELVRAMIALDAVNMMRRREKLQQVAMHVRRNTEAIVDRAHHNNQVMEPLEGVEKMNGLLDSCMYVSRENAEGYMDVVPVHSALGAEITSRFEVREREITEKLSEERKEKCAVRASGRASSEGKKPQKPSEKLSAESIVETRVQWLGKELPPAQASAEAFKYQHNKECESQMQQKTQAFADAMANPAKRREYMKEWNGKFGEFGQFCKYFDDYAELAPLPKSDEGGGGIAKQMYQRRFTKEDRRAHV